MEALEEYKRLTIQMIAIRAKRDWGLDRAITIMDLHTVNADMDFDWLLRSESVTFTHDICGINQHLNRETGKLMMGFVPICLKQNNEQN